MKPAEIINHLQTFGNSPIPIDIHLFDSLPSTNSHLWKLVEQGACEGTVVIARTQTAGKGTHGKQWLSDLGGLYLSLALSPNLPVNHGPWLTMAIAWGICNALILQNIPVQIKWPNDFLLNKAKLGGMLIETKIHGNNIKKAIVGVGINYQNNVPEMGMNLIKWNKFEPNYSTIPFNVLTSAVIWGIINGYQRCHPDRIGGLITDYSLLLEALGRQVEIDNQVGVVLGVNEKGELKIGFPSAKCMTEICFQPGNFTLGYKSK
jgi:BirA family biotin operon repressor/biotin-[acetyl-CoA-carboxylase] ligase